MMRGVGGLRRLSSAAGPTLALHLRATLRTGLESDRARFLDLLAPGEAGPQELLEAAQRVAAEAERLLAGLDAAGGQGASRGEQPAPGT